ncbi:MAG: MogA/MoaB family molybdenum cofactor biosynthesis protein [Tissierellia bacterium]|nr:MogA/MoaB family molybdenum cofactor biosynthesis protein [Tissierellia bacterium]
MFNYAIIIASDTRSKGENKDLCADKIKSILKDSDYNLVYQNIIADEIEDLKAELIALSDEKKVNLIITSGGTGLAKRDVTPDATLAVIDRQVPGISMAMALASREKTPMWMLSRAVSGIRKETLIINLPGSPKAVEECLQAVLPGLYHGLEIINRIVKQH